MKKKLMSLLTLCSIFTITTQALANKYEYNNDWGSQAEMLEADRPLCGTYDAPSARSIQVGYLRTANFFFDNTTNTFRFETIIEGCKDNIADTDYKLADSFWLVVNDGPNPKGHAGELSIAYFDATNPSNPIVTMYGYNGANSTNSYYDGSKLAGVQAPDRLFSNHPLSTDTNILNEISVMEFTQTGTHGSIPAKKIILDFDATSIISHTPNYPEAMIWSAMKFNNSIGVWFHMTDSNTMTYCTDGDTHANCQRVLAGQSATGYLKHFWINKNGSFDIANQLTNSYPFCTGTFSGHTKFDKANSCYVVEPGKEFTTTITADDSDDSTLIVSYTGVPMSADVLLGDSAGPSLGSGSATNTPLDVTMIWTPSLSDGGSTVNADFTFTDPHGADKSCPVSICVPVDNPPTCDIKITSDNPGQCQGTVTSINFDATLSNDPEGKPVEISLSTDCENGGVDIDKGNGLATLDLTQPGLGNGVTGCSVFASVSDGSLNPSVICSIPVNVEPCNLDCAGTIDGPAVVDQCGICDGDGTTCLDCAGDTNGSAVVDQCGVCNGSNSCLDCAGDVNGVSITDLCGVCGGDNTSCLDCSDTDVTEIQFLIDGGVKALEGVINQILFKVRNSKKKKIQTFISETQEQAHNLQVRNWIISWLFPSVSSQCSANPICTTVSNVSLKTEYSAKDLELLELGFDVSKKVFKLKRRNAKKRGASRSKLRKFRKAQARYNEQFVEQFEANEANLALIPDTYSECL